MLILVPLLLLCWRFCAGVKLHLEFLKLTRSSDWEIPFSVLMMDSWDVRVLLAEISRSALQCGFQARSVGAFPPLNPDPTG